MAKLIGTEVNVPEMAERREMRVRTQEQLLREYQRPVLTFCLNIPGPVKTTEALRRLFTDGKAQIEAALSQQGWEVLAAQEVHEITGDELLLSVDASAEDLKAVMSEIEEIHPLGRLFDIDIIQLSGEKLSRPSFRRCLLCEKQAQECARTRAHSVAEMQEKIAEMVEAYFSSQQA